jgi:hypothetical protein
MQLFTEGLEAWRTNVNCQASRLLESFKYLYTYVVGVRRRKERSAGVRANLSCQLTVTFVNRQKVLRTLYVVHYARLKRMIIDRCTILALE